MPTATSAMPALPPSSPVKPWLPSLLAFILCAIAVAGVYSNSTRNDFALDDWHTIQQNAYVRSLSFIPNYFTDATTFSVFKDNRDYRPMIDVGYAIDYAWAKSWFGDGYDPRPWHWTNLFIHYVVCVSLYFLGRRLIGRGGLAPIPGISPRAGDWVALIAALLFAIHPITTGCGNYITARSSSMVAAFGLPALNLYLSVLAGSRGRWPLFPSLALFGLALFTKVEAVSFIAVFGLAEILFGNGVAEMPLYRRLFRPSMWMRLTPYIFLTLAYLVVWSTVSPLLTSTSRTNVGWTPYLYFCTQLKAWWYYIGHIVAPVRLVSDDQAFPISMNLEDPAAVLALVGWAIVIYLSVRLIRTAPAVPFLVGSFFFYLAPHSSIVPLAEMVNEHRPYLPCAGLFILLTAGLYLVLARLGPRPVLQLAAVAVVLAAPLAALTYQRNFVWRDDLSLWGDSATKSPTSSRAQMNYGLALMKRGRMAEAEDYFRNCIRLAPNYALTYTNLGIALQHDGEYLARNGNVAGAQSKIAEAAASHDRAVQLTPSDSTVYYWRGLFRLSQHDLNGAIEDFQTAVRLNDAAFRDRVALAECLLLAGRTQDAQPVIDRGRALDAAGFERERETFRKTFLK